MVDAIRFFDASKFRTEPVLSLNIRAVARLILRYFHVLSLAEKSAIDHSVATKLPELQYG